MTVTVKRDVSDAGRKLVEALRAGGLSNDRRVGKVGWFKDNRYPETGTPVAEIAAQNEFGNPAKYIPPRPTLRPTISKKREYWKRVARKGAMDILKEGVTTPGHVLEVVGLTAADDFRGAINQLKAPALSPRTIDARIQKKKKGRILFAGVDKPLIESGIMLKTLTNVVEDE